MPLTRRVGIAVAHVEAEVAAAPLAIEAAFRHGLTALDPLCKDATGAYWRDAENALLRAFPSTTVDELTNLRDKLWFEPRPDAGLRPLHEHLRRLNTRFLHTSGGEVRPCLARERLEERPVEGAHARWFWRWLSLALPPDLLLAAAPSGTPPNTSVEVVTTEVARSLGDDGYAQLHLHLGAATRFDEFWVRVLLVLADPRVRHTAMASPGADFDEGRQLAAWLLRAALARTLLAGHLVARRAEQRFDDYLAHVVEPRLSPTAVVTLRRALRELERPAGVTPTRASFASLQALYVRLGRVNVRRQPGADVQALDPLAAHFGHGLNRATPEMRFVSGALAHLESLARQKEPGARDERFARLFWQVVRLRNAFYRHVTQRPLVRGLQWFFRFYGRLEPAAWWGRLHDVSTAAALEGGRRGLRALEYRTTPKDNVSAMLATLAQPVSPRPGPEFGLVLHFVRDRGGQMRAGRPEYRWQRSHADPRTNPSGYRYAKYYAAKRREALALAWVLTRHPWSLLSVRGLDTCTDELGVPTWVLAPLFRYVQAASEAAARALRECWGAAIPSLRLTAHAGEDFLHLAGGLRRIDEALMYLRLGEGSRLGHAIALGTDPEAWVSRVGHVALPVEERLLDLLWEWSCYASGKVQAVPGARGEYLGREIPALAGRMFGTPFSAFALERAYRRLHHEETLRALGFPGGRRGVWSPPKGRPDEPAQLALAYLTNRAVFTRGRELLWVDPAVDLPALVALQDALRTRVARLGITVEVNPTSNLLIGDLADLREHPLFRLAPVQGDPATDAIPVALCSDDPLTFATRLPDEYQYVYDALLLGGFPDDAAWAWLDRRRRESLRARFTLPDVDAWLRPVGGAPRDASLLEFIRRHSAAPAWVVPPP